MFFLWSAIKKDFWRRRRDPWAFLLWLGIPLVIASLFTLILGGPSGPQPKIHLFIADQDQTLVSSLVSGFFEQGPMADLFTVEPVARETGLKKMDEGAGSALLIIPKNFGEAVLNQTPTELEIITNPAQRFSPGLVLEGASLLADAVFYLQQIFGDEIKTIGESLQATNRASQGWPSLDAAQLGQAIGQKMQLISQNLFPPRISVERVRDERVAARAEASFALLFFPSFLLMAIVFSAQGISSDFWRERELGTLRRFISTPQGIAQFVVGKMITAAWVTALICALLLLIGFFYHGISMSKFPVALGWLVLAGVGFCGLMALIQIFAPTHRAGSLITFIVVFPLLMMGGSFFPFESMPAWMAAIGKWTPNGIVLEQLKSYLLDRYDANVFLISFVALAGICLVIWVVNLLRSPGFARGS